MFIWETTEEALLLVLCDLARHCAPPRSLSTCDAAPLMTGEGVLPAWTRTVLSSQFVYVPCRDHVALLLNGVNLFSYLSVFVDIQCDNSGAMSSDKCFICEKDVSEGAMKVVKEKGIDTLREASKKRNDGKGAVLAGKIYVSVHVSCQKSYINERMIAAHLKKAARPSTSSGKLRSSSEYFDCKTHCFVCGTDIPEDYARSQQRLPLHKRNLVHLVTKIEMKDTVMKQAQLRGDDFGAAVINRIQPITDMVAADCKYHDKCLKNLYIRRPKPAKRKPVGPHAEEVQRAMNDIFTFMESNDEECQFSLDELITQVEGNYIPERKTVIQHLLERYGEDVIISKIKQSTIVCFKNTGHKILTDAWYNEKRSSEREERLRLVETAADVILEEIRSVPYALDDYPPPDSFLSENESLVPEVLKVFLERLILTKKRGNTDKWKKKSFGHFS